MRTLKRYLVKNMMIFGYKKQLIFKDSNAKRTPAQVTLAMIAVAKYLGWLDGNANEMVRVDQSKDKQKFYVAAEPVMQLQEGTVKTCCFDRWQLTRAINYANATKNYCLIPENAVELSEMLWVQKLPPVKDVEEEDFYTINYNLVKFLESKCGTPGTYEFNVDTIMSHANIPLSKLLSYYLVKQLGEESVNDMTISSITTEDDKINISFHY